MVEVKNLDPTLQTLRDKVLETEADMDGAQVTWASTPKDVPTLRGKGILFSGVVGSRRQYAFPTEEKRELFVYDRHDTLFTVSKDIRNLLGLSPPVFRGTIMTSSSGEAQSPTPKKRKNKFRKR